jgi:hypothetical protein
MRKLFPAIQSFLIVGGLYGSPIVMALFGSLAPTLELAPPPVQRAAVFQLALLDLEDSGKDTDDAPGAQEESQVASTQGGSGSSSAASTGTSGRGAGVVLPTATPDLKAGPLLAAKAMPSLGNRPIRHVRKKQRRRKRRKCLEGTDDITEVGHNRYAVERDLVDYYAKNLEALSRLAWVKWHENEAGKVDGFEVRRVRCGSVLYEAGLRNGDVVHAVNGRRIRSLARAIPLWWHLRRRPVVHVRITRGDESMRLWYRLS